MTILSLAVNWRNNEFLIIPVTSKGKSGYISVDLISRVCGSCSKKTILSTQKFYQKIGKNE